MKPNKDLLELEAIVDDELVDLEKWSTENNDAHLDQITTFIRSWEILKRIINQEETR